MAGRIPLSRGFVQPKHGWFNARASASSSHPGSRLFAQTVIWTRQTSPLATCTALATKRSGPSWLGVRATTSNDLCWLNLDGTANSRLSNIGRFTPVLGFTRAMRTSHCGRGRLVVTLNVSTIMSLALTLAVSATCDRRSEHAALADATLRAPGSTAAAAVDAVETVAATAKGTIIAADQDFLFMTPTHSFGAPTDRRVHFRLHHGQPEWWKFQPRIGYPALFISADWLRKRLTEPGGPAVDLPGRPRWCDPARPNPYRSDGALWLIDAGGCALATLVLKDVPGACWEGYRIPQAFQGGDAVPHRPHGPAGGASRRSWQDRLLRCHRPLSTLSRRSRRAARSLRPPDRAMSARNRAKPGHNTRPVGATRG
jgi:hypothetical protein